MKCQICILLLVINANVLYAQSSINDSLDYYISKLDWNAATVATTYVPKVVLNNYAQNLVAAKNTTTDQKLFDKICDSEKTVAIYVILTQRHKYPVKFKESENRQNTDSITKYQMEHYKKDTLWGVFYTYNDIQWYYDLSTGQSKISKDNIKSAHEYWRRKLKQAN